MIPRSIPLWGSGACLFAVVLGIASPLQADDQPRQRLTADFGWKFTKGDTPGADKPDFDDTAWRTLDLPHDWSIEGPYTQSDPTGGGGGSLPTGIGWYRRAFVAPEAWRRKNVFVEFAGVYMNSDVWLNGQLLGHRPFGYISFEYNLTPYLKFGHTNVLSVRVDNSHQPNSRWYSGSGITGTCGSPSPIRCMSHIGGPMSQPRKFPPGRPPCAFEPRFKTIHPPGAT